MSNASSSSSGGGTGRVLLWVALALTTALLTYVTAMAANNNPIKSDRDAYGISKYHFIEECRDALHTPNDLPLMTGMGQTQPLLTAVKGTGEMKANHRMLVESTATPQEINSAVTDMDGKLQLLLPVMIQLKDIESGYMRPLVPVTMQCVYDKSKTGHERLQVMLVPGAGG